ncbi:MAG: hypothetical protein ACOYL6_07950 [Bacteriovoracaceae bacterium]
MKKLTIAIVLTMSTLAAHAASAEKECVNSIVLKSMQAAHLEVTNVTSSYPGQKPTEAQSNARNNFIDAAEAEAIILCKALYTK